MKKISNSVKFSLIFFLGAIIMYSAVAFVSPKQKEPKSPISIMDQPIEVHEVAIDIITLEVSRLGQKYNVPVNKDYVRKELSNLKITPNDLLYAYENRDRFIQMVKDRR